MTRHDKSRTPAGRQKAKASTAGNRIELRKLSKLRPHPLQQQIYDRCSDAEDKALAASIKTHGLEHPIEVMPPGNLAGLPANTVIDGHRRWQALKSLGWTEANVVVRSDLRDLTRAEADAAFVRANRERRQLDTVQVVRAAIHEYCCLHHGGQALHYSELQAAREEIGALIGRSGRTASRYFRLMDGLVPIQRLVTAKNLRLIDGEKIANLPRQIQQAIVNELGENPAKSRVREILRRHIPSRQQQHRKVNDALACFMKLVERGAY